MEISSIIIDRPWLCDHDATLYGLPNFYSFHHPRKVIEFNPTPSKDNNKRGFSTLTSEETFDLNLIASTDLEEEMLEEAIVWMLDLLKDISDLSVRE